MFHSDYDDSLRFLRLIHPRAAWIEIRVKGAKGVYGRNFADLDDAADYAAERSEQPETVAVWVTTNAIDIGTWQDSQKLVGDHNISTRTACFIDFDAVYPDGEKTNSTEAELEATRVAAVQCIEYLSGLGFPRPALITSGNGHQVWYRVNLPADDGGLIERFLIALAAKFPGVDQTVYNPGRVGRLPGTMNRRDPETPERPHRLAKIVDAPPHLEVLTRELLESVASVVSLPDAVVPVPEEINPILFDVEGFLTKHNHPFQPRKRKGDGWLWDIKCPFRPEETDGGAWIWQSDEGVITAKCKHRKCAGKGWKEIRKAIDPDFDKTAKAALPTGIGDAECLARRHLEGHPHCVLYQESIYEYQAGVYVEHKPAAIKRDIRRTMMRVFAEYADWQRKQGLNASPPSVNEKLVASVYGVLTSIVPEIEVAAPCWLDGRPIKDSIVCANGVVDLSSLVLTPHTPEMFVVSKLPYDYDPDATCPRWNTYLEELWKDDPEAIQLAQEIAGYTLLADNPLQVLMLLQGASRGGKGVFVRMLCEMVGRENTTSISIRNITKQFHLWGARGKSIIMIPDVRAPQKGLPSEIVEMLNIISGNDTLDINGKNRDIVSETLSGKLIATTNDLLVFDDPSGALFNRLIVLKFTRSFLPPDHPEHVEGQDQDPELEAKLALELPGILNWSIQGLQQLRKRWQFTRPASSVALKEELASESSPIKQFVANHLIRDPHGRVTVNELYTLWVQWCVAEDIDPISPRSMGMLLRSACPWAKCERSSTLDATGVRPREYHGITIKNTVRHRTPA